MLKKAAGISNYLSTETILSGATMINCHTLQTIAKFGHLDITCFTEDLPAGSELELPLWLVIALWERKSPFLTAKVPSEYVEVLTHPGDEHMNLGKVSPNFYELGLLYAKLLNPEGQKQLSEDLFEFFRGRMLAMAELDDEIMPTGISKSIISHATKPQIKSSFMDNFERKLYEDSVANGCNMRNWLEPLSTTTPLELSQDQEFGKHRQLPAEPCLPPPATATDDVETQAVIGAVMGSDKADDDTQYIAAMSCVMNNPYPDFTLVLEGPQTDAKCKSTSNENVIAQEEDSVDPALDDILMDTDSTLFDL